MEVDERPERGEADAVGNQGLDNFRQLAIEYDEKADDGGAKAQDDLGPQGRPPEKVEVQSSQDAGQASEGLEEFRPYAQKLDDQQDKARASSTKEATSVSEDSATIMPEPPTAVEPAADQDVRPLDGSMTTRPGAESDEVQVGAYEDFQDQVPVSNQEPPPPKRAEAKLGTEDLHRFPSEQEPKPEAEEPRVLEAVDYGKGAVLRVPKNDLEKAGFEPEAGQNSIIELGLKNVENEDVETVFARYVASDRRAEAYVGDIGGKKGSEYELVEAWGYDEDGFVRDFERSKCEHLQNVSLEHAEHKMFLDVDNRKVDLEEYRLTTSGSHVILRGKLDGDSDCKIEFDGRKVSFRFGRDYPIEEMKMEGDDLVVKYAQSKNEKHEHRIYLEHLKAPEQPSLNQFDKPEMREHVKMFDHPERVEGEYQFVLDKATQNEIRRLLDDAEKRGENEYGHMKAEISERLVPNLLELVGWERIKWHPFSENTKEGASANGTDWLLWTPDRKLAIAEVKWFADRTDAIRKGEAQVAKDFDQNRQYGDLKLKGAYIAIMDWNMNDEAVKVFVKRVRPLEDLE